MIYKEFRKTFAEMVLDILNVDDLKSEAAKEVIFEKKNVFNL